MADNGVQLESFLVRAGGAAQAANLEELMRLAGGAGRVGRLEGLLNIAARNAARFQELAEWTIRLSRRSAAVPVVAPPPEVAALGFSGADMPHFVSGHFWEFLDIPSRLGKASTTLWPPGTAPNSIQAGLAEALRRLNPAGGPRLPLPNTPLPSSNGTVPVQVGSRIPGGAAPTTPPEIGQYFPVSQPGYVTIFRDELRAIWDILRP
jgi:hypothetical protein